MTRVLRPLIVFAGLLLAWEILSRAAGLPPFILPPPSAVLVTLGARHELLLQHASVTLAEILLGLLFGVLLGGASALLLAGSTRARSWLLPLVVASQALPVFAIAPLLVIWLGFGLASKIAMAALIIFSRSPPRLPTAWRAPIPVSSTLPPQRRLAPGDASPSPPAGGAAGARLGLARRGRDRADRRRHRRMGRRIGGSRLHHAPGQRPRCRPTALRRSRAARRHGRGAPRRRGRPHPTLARLGAGRGRIDPERKSSLMIRTLVVVALLVFSPAAGAEDRLSVLLDWFVNPDHAPLVVAQREGLFRRGRVLRSNWSPRPIRAPRHASSPPAKPTSRSPTSRTSTCRSPRACRSTLRHAGRHAAQHARRARGRPGKTIADLKGRTIGFSVGGFEDALLKRMLERAG